jgi:hypothetical protein
MENTEAQINADAQWMPEGFVQVVGPNGQHYLVPEFYAPALQNDIDRSEEKKKMEIDKGAGTVSYHFYRQFICRPVAI